MKRNPIALSLAIFLGLLAAAFQVGAQSTIVERYSPPAPIPFTVEMVESPASGLVGTFRVPSLRMILHNDVAARTQSTYGLAMGHHDLDWLKHDLEVTANLVLSIWPNAGRREDVMPQVEAAYFDYLRWRDAALKDLWEDIDLGKGPKLDTLPPPPPDYVKPVVVNGPGQDLSGNPVSKDRIVGPCYSANVCQAGPSPAVKLLRDGFVLEENGKRYRTHVNISIFGNEVWFEPLPPDPIVPPSNGVTPKLQLLEWDLQRAAAVPNTTYNLRIWNRAAAVRQQAVL